MEAVRTERAGTAASATAGCGAGAAASTGATIGAGTGRLRANAIGGNISLLCRPVDEDFGRDGPEPEDTGPDTVGAAR